MTQVCPCAWEPPRCSWAAPSSGPRAHCTYPQTGKGVNKTSSLFQSLTVLECLNFQLWCPDLPVILCIIAKKSLEVLEERKSAWAIASACMARARRMWALLKHNCSSTGLRNPGCWEAFMQDVPANAFTRLLCPSPNSNCNYRHDKMENKYICSSWEKPISFAPVRNNAELLVSLTNWLSIYIVMYLHDPTILRKNMTTKCMLEV